MGQRRPKPRDGTSDCFGSTADSTLLAPKRKKLPGRLAKELGSGLLKSWVGLLRRKAGFQCSCVACPNSAPTQKPPNPQIRGFKRYAAAVSSAMTCAIVLCSGNAQLSPVGTSRAAIAASTCRQAP